MLEKDVYRARESRLSDLKRIGNLLLQNLRAQDKLLHMYVITVLYICLCNLGVRYYRLIVH